MSIQKETGVLYIVATPIGNLADITHRAVNVLGSVDLVLCEDTRQTRILLAHYGINARLEAFHEHNEDATIGQIIDLLNSGQNLALVSDAGTPLINDPGFTLVRTVREAGLRAVPVPGASAVICALSAAGLPTDKFTFLGFVPRNASARQSWLTSLLDDSATLVMYESPRRILTTLEDVSDIFGKRHLVLARELTKLYESFISGNAAEVIAQLQAEPEQIRGEMVLLIEGCPEMSEQPGLDVRLLLRELLKELPLSKAAAIAARVVGKKRAEMYDLGRTLNGTSEQSD